MSGPAAWLVGRRALRVVLIAVTFPLPFASLLSGALVVLVTLLTDWRTASVDVLAALGIVVVGLALGDVPWLSVLPGAFMLWIGALVGGHLLGRHGSLSLALQLVVGLGLLGVMLAGAITGDPAAVWQPALERMMEDSGLGPDILPPGWLQGVAGLMNGLIAGSVLTSVLLAWLLGSWMATRADGRNYRQAFLALRLGRVLAALAALVAVLGLLAFRSTAANLMLVFAVAFACQGLSVIHWLAGHRRWPKLWPLALYVPLLITTPLTVMILGTLVTVGFLDNWHALRRPSRDVV